MKIIKILGIFTLLLISSCARNVEPLSNFEIETRSQEDIATIEDIKKNNLNWDENIEIDLYTAISLAIKNNRELRLKLLENALANRQIDKVRFEMLPAIAANAGYSGSERYTASASASVPTTDLAGSIGTSYSTSRERDVNSQDVGFTWNALDFGLSYIRAGQDSNRYLITEEMERKAEHNIIRDVIRSYWNTISADKLIKKYDPLLIEVDKALNDSQKIEELLLTKPMDALLYQKELLDIQRALQTQKEIFIDARIQLAGLMGLLPDQQFTIIPTNEPLTILNMSLRGMEEYALLHRPELRKSHYDEEISIQEAKASITSLLPGLNFNAAWTHSSNDHLMNKTNLEYGSVVGANLLNVFMYPKVKRINEMNTEIIREKRLALSMAVLSQVHLANIDYSLALEEYNTAERYYEVSRKITEQIKNAQKIARFGNLELIREQASLLVAELRYDIAYSKLQHAIGKIYTSVGFDVTKENIREINFKDYASIIKNNFMSNGKRYYAKIKKPIKNQNPVVKRDGGSRISQFSFSDNTFVLEGEGRIIYSASLSSGKPLPSWITFLPSQKTFIVDNSEKDNTEELDIKVVAKNINTRIEDKFTLMVDPELRVTRLENEKRLKEQRKLAKKQKQEEAERLKAEKILEEEKAKKERELLAIQEAEAEEQRLIEEKEEAELLAQQEAEEKRLIEKKEEAELLAQQEAEEKRLIEEKKQQELLEIKKAREERLLEQKRQKELLAKQKREELNKVTENELLALREQLYAQLVGNKNESLYETLYGKNNFDKPTINLIKAKDIEAKINDMLLSLDLNKRIDVTKSIIQDLFKSDFFDENNNVIDFKTLNYKMNLERSIIDKLDKYPNKYNFN